MIVEPKVRGFICTTAHPIGCRENVIEQIKYVRENHKSKDASDNTKTYKNVLIIGGSTGYGLASRIFSIFSLEANTINVCLEKPPKENRTASAGWYNTASLEKFAEQENLTTSHFSVIGDAFSNQAKDSVKGLIEEKSHNLGKIDLLIYSLASPQRKDPSTGEVYRSVIKPINDSGQKITMKGIDLNSEQVKEIELEPASDEEIKNTTKVMGGEDWELWVEYLKNNDLLENGFTSIAFSYIGPEVTRQVYRNGTIGKAKEDLEKTSLRLNQNLGEINGKALISVNKALVTQAAAAIPVLPLYISILFKVMKEKSLHEGCIEQIHRMFVDKLFLDQEKDNMLYLDDYEMKSEVQEKVLSTWKEIKSDNLNQLSDFSGYKKEFLKLFGFGLDGVDYTKEVDPMMTIENYFKETI